MKKITIGIIAPSSVVPKIELELGVAKLQSEGFNVVVHPTVLGENWFYSASDQDRANAFIEFALNTSIDIIWCARGGYGATNLLPLIEKATKRKKVPQKTLIGYSDATALLEFTRTRYKWKTLHAPMVALKTFSKLKPLEWSTLMTLIKPSAKKQKVYSYPLVPIFKPKGFKAILADVTGGNFAVWNALIGTPYEGNAKGKILFFEDLQENVARINRMIHHLEQSGGFKGVKAIVLGDFLDCRDTAPLVFKTIPLDLHHPTPDELMPLRSINDSKESLRYIFNELGNRTGIAVFEGAPIGHGENQFSLSFHEKNTISAKAKGVALGLVR